MYTLLRCEKIDLVRKINGGIELTPVDLHKYIDWCLCFLPSFDGIVVIVRHFVNWFILSTQ